MRDLIFRAIPQNENGFVYGNLVLGMGKDKTFCEIEQTDIEEYQKWICKRETVGQYTGLNDKNGNGIYEGDIVKYIVPGTEPLEDVLYNELVKFEDGCFVVEGAPLYATIDWGCEIIGNAFQNPELLP